MQIATVCLLQLMQAYTLNVTANLIFYLSKFLHNTLKDEGVQGRWAVGICLNKDTVWSLSRLYSGQSTRSYRIDPINCVRWLSILWTRVLTEHRLKNTTIESRSVPKWDMLKVGGPCVTIVARSIFFLLSNLTTFYWSSDYPGHPALPMPLRPLRSIFRFYCSSLHTVSYLSFHNGWHTQCPVSPTIVCTILP